MNDLLSTMINNNKKTEYSYLNTNVTMLYKLIDDYIKTTGICEENENGKYLVKENGVGFEIGIDFGPDIFYYVKRLDNNDLDNFIDMNYVNNNLITVKQAVIKKELSDINKRINALEEKGVSRKLIKKYLKM